MLRFVLLALAASAALLAAPCRAQPSVAASAPAPAAEAVRLLVGVWRAVPGGMYAEAEGGKRVYPFGPDAVARFILTGDGFGANTLQAAGRASCAIGPGPRQCTPAEAEAAFQTASSYQFRYRLEPDADTPYRGRMIWTVDLSVYPNWVGQTLIRRYEIEPDGSAWTLLAPLPSNPALAFRIRLERER
jgi:hypothetical protein